LLKDVFFAGELSFEQSATSPNSTCWITLSLYINIFREGASFQRLEDVWFDESGRNFTLALTNMRSLA
jgi:hypothetical protein